MACGSVGGSAQLGSEPGSKLGLACLETRFGSGLRQRLVLGLNFWRLGSTSRLEDRLSVRLASVLRA